MKVLDSDTCIGILRGRSSFTLKSEQPAQSRA